MKGKEGAEIHGLHIRNGFRRQQLKPLRKLSHALLFISLQIRTWNSR